MERRHAHSWVHVDAHVERVRRIHQWRTHPNDPHADDADDHHAHSPCDLHEESRHGRNLGHGHVGARASQRNYATRLVIATERYRVILASESFLMHCGVRVQEQRRSDSAP